MSNILTIEVLNSETPITQAQQAVLDALKGKDYVSVDDLMSRFKMQSQLPLMRRIDHLVECGRLRLV